MKIINKIKAYYSRKSRITLVFDILFYLFVILMIIPPTRRQLASLILRVTLHQPIITGTPEPGNIFAEEMTWELISRSGERLGFSQLQGKVVFLNFWATWCPPCIAEMPSIQKLYDEFGDRITFILVSHEPEEEVRAFTDDKGYSLPVYKPGTATPEIFEHRSIPTTFLISGTGEIVMKHKGAVKWDGKKIKKMMNELLDE